MNQLRIRATKLREIGFSYGMIKQELGVSKSTLSNWLAHIPFIPNELAIEKIGAARLKTALHKQKTKFDDIQQRKSEAAKEVGKLSRRDILMLGIGLYLGEGSKSIEDVRIANSDPVIIRLATKWLGECCKIDRRHFRVTLHAYPDNDQNEIINFWSTQIQLPKEQFTKVIIDTRKNKTNLKKRKLPYGTAHLYVRGGGVLNPGVKSLHRKIMGWIEASTRQI